MSKNLLVLVGIDGLLLVLIIGALRKIQPVFLDNLVNHCQKITTSLVFHLPHVFWSLLVMSFLAILAFTLVRIVYGFIRFRQLTRKFSTDLRLQKKLAAQAGKLGLNDKTILVESDQAFAFCAGIFFPRIYLSIKLLTIINGSELAAVLRHERHHLQNHDTLTIFFAYLSQSLFPFFPISSDLSQKFRVEREIEADWVAAAGPGFKKPLVNALRKILMEQLPQVAFAPAIANFDGLETRVKALIFTNYSQSFFKTKNAIFSLVTLLFLLGVFFAPVEAIEFHDNGQDVMLVCVSNSSVSTPTYSIPATRLR